MIEYKIKESSQKDIFLHLRKCNQSFVPVLSNKVDLAKYSTKIFDYAVTFEAWEESEIIGLIAAYFNDDKSKKGFITNVSVIPDRNNKGIAGNLINMVKDYASKNSFEILQLEVHLQNIKAIEFYLKKGFEIIDKKEESIDMEFKKVKL